MRSPTDDPPVSWAARIFRPWLVASVFGSALGLALLNVDSEEAPSSYVEPASRAAVYDQPFIPSAVDLPVTVADGTFVPEPPLAPLTGLIEGASAAEPPELP